MSTPVTPSTFSSLSVLYECGGCGERLLDERRCDEPILLADVLQEVAGRS